MMPSVSAGMGSVQQYTNPSISVDFPLVVNRLSSGELLGGLESALGVPLTEDETNTLYSDLPNYLRPASLILELGLPGFTSFVWSRLSNRNYTKITDYKTFGTRLYNDALLRLMIQHFSGLTQETNLEVILIGDYKELVKIIDVMNSETFYVPGINLSWKGLAPDPHEIIDSNYKAAVQSWDLRVFHPNFESTEARISSGFPAYDSDLGNRWFSGPDGTGLLTNENIVWLANRTQKSLMVIGAIDRTDYLDDSPELINVYYRVCLAVLASTAESGTASIKISLPFNRALLGVYALFSLFFKRVRLVKFKQFTPDDNTVYLLGMTKIQAAPALYGILSGDRNLEERIMNFLGKYTAPINTEINTAFSARTSQWIGDVRNTWAVRNL